MATEYDYLKMQLDFYDNEAKLWSLNNKNTNILIVVYRKLTLMHYA